MKAAQINDYGDASVIHINEIEVPKISDDQVLVEVHASSLNPYDTILREGHMREMLPLAFPATLGGDIAGIITEIGANVANVAVGDKIYGQAYIVAGNSGAFAEYAATTANEVAKMPQNLDYSQASSLPLVAISALQAIRHHINLQPNQKILINGAGAIGTIAVQIAKSIGAYVAITATGDTIDYIKQFDADEIIDYKTTDFSEILTGYDAIFNTVRDDSFNKSLAILRPGGVIVSMVGGIDEARAKEHNITAIAQGTKVRTEILNELTALIEKDIVTPQIDTVFPLDQIQEAFKLRDAGNTHGKVVITIQ